MLGIEVLSHSIFFNITQQSEIPLREAPPDAILFLPTYEYNTIQPENIHRPLKPTSLLTNSKATGIVKCYRTPVHHNITNVNGCSSTSPPTPPDPPSSESRVDLAHLVVSVVSSQCGDRLPCPPTPPIPPPPPPPPSGGGRRRR